LCGRGDPGAGGKAGFDVTSGGIKGKLAECLPFERKRAYPILLNVVPAIPAYPAALSGKAV
jgi:hypothetical protein